MNDREKLIELIGLTQYGKGSLICKNFQQGFIEKIADFLIANGVTFATDTNVSDKWRPASEPPEVWRDKNGTLVNYLIYMPEYGVDVGNYVKPAKRWLCVGLPVKVSRWMPLPEPPKEGR